MSKVGFDSWEKTEKWTKMQELFIQWVNRLKSITKKKRPQPRGLKPQSMHMSMEAFGFFGMSTTVCIQCPTGMCQLGFDRLEKIKNCKKVPPPLLPHFLHHLHHLHHLRHLHHRSRTQVPNPRRKQKQSRKTPKLKYKHLLRHRLHPPHLLLARC